MNAYTAVVLCWVTGIICGTYLIANGLHWWGIGVVALAMMAGTSKRED